MNKWIDKEVVIIVEESLPCRSRHRMAATDNSARCSMKLNACVVGHLCDYHERRARSARPCVGPRGAPSFGSLSRPAGRRGLGGGIPSAGRRPGAR
eukprot:6912888-Pyramimonas_sp.AAC.1